MSMPLAIVPNAANAANGQIVPVVSGGHIAATGPAPPVFNTITPLATDFANKANAIYAGLIAPHAVWPQASDKFNQGTLASLKQTTAQAKEEGVGEIFDRAPELLGAVERYTHMSGLFTWHTKGGSPAKTIVAGVACAGKGHSGICTDANNCMKVTKGIVQHQLKIDVLKNKLKTDMHRSNIALKQKKSEKDRLVRLAFTNQGNAQVEAHKLKACGEFADQELLDDELKHVFAEMSKLDDALAWAFRNVAPYTTTATVTWYMLLGMPSGGVEGTPTANQIISPLKFVDNLKRMVTWVGLCIKCQSWVEDSINKWADPAAWDAEAHADILRRTIAFAGPEFKHWETGLLNAVSTETVDENENENDGFAPDNMEQ